MWSRRGYRLHPGPHGRGATPRARMAGLTLLEMLLVMALIAAIGLLTAMAMSGGLDGMRLRSSAKQLAAQLRYTRTQAIASGVPQRFSIDPRTHRWEAASGRHGELPPSLSIRFTGAREVQPQAHVGAIAFFEDGASTGGRIELQTGDAQWRIDVGWITGEVKAGPVTARSAQ